MKTAQKVNQKETVQRPNKDKYQYLFNKITQTTSQEKRNIAKLQKNQDYSTGNQPNIKIGSANKNTTALWSSFGNSTEYELKDLGIQMKMSNQNLNREKTDCSLVLTNQTSANNSQELSKNTKKLQNAKELDGKNKPQLVRSPQLLKKSQSPFAKKTELDQQLISKQLKSNKSIDILDIKTSQIQTPTFQNLQLSKKSLEIKPQAKAERIKLRDYLFMAQVSSEAVATKKRMQRASSKSSVLEPVPQSLKHCLSQETLRSKKSPAKYTISNQQMANVLSRQIMQEILSLRQKISHVQSWLAEAPSNEASQITPFYIVRQDLKTVNSRFEDMINKIFAPHPQPLNQNKLDQMKQSVAISRIANPNLKDYEI